MQPQDPVRVRVVVVLALEESVFAALQVAAAPVPQNSKCLKRGGVSPLRFFFIPNPIRRRKPVSLVISPPKRIVYEKDDWYLFFDPNNVTWVKVNEDGRKILTAIENNPDFDTFSHQLQREYNTDAATIRQFVDYMVERAWYLHWDEYRCKEIIFSHENIVPKTLYIHPTYRCNLRCVYCYNGNERHFYTGNTNYDELTIADYHKLFEEANELGIGDIVYSGGEPLLREELFEIARISKEMGFHNNIITNGTLINREKAAALKDHFHRVSVSIDSCVADENDCMRGKGAHQRALNGISLLLEQDVKVNCLGVVHPGNIDNGLKSWHYFVKELGCVTFMPQLFITHDQACHESPELYDAAQNYGRMRCQINHWNKNKSAAALRNNCGMCTGELAIGADGNVFPCQTLLKEELCGGNIKHQSLREILEKSPQLKKMREFSVDQVKECSSCDIKYLCGGACRGIHSNITGDILKNNPYYCAANKEIIVNTMFEISSAPNKSERQINNHETGAALPGTCL
ncbi:MAG: hypothetical protein QG657_1827 [Acidobacteriota bacterium]|nr:hypothetical protein [Acidobacteriota bacterium]